jgi:hypothetical protein
MEEIVALLILILLLLAGLQWYESQEGFAPAPAPASSDPIALSACPSDMKTFYLADGRTACCNGPVVGSRCTGAVQCTMTGEGTTDLPSCASLLQKDYQEKGKSACPPSLSSYFEDKGTKKKGCTSGALNMEMTLPATTTQPTCFIYQTLEENLTKKDSCELQRQLEATPCFGTQCNKRVLSTGEEGNPPLVAIQFVDKSGMYRTAYTRKSLEYYLNQTRPSWRDEGLNLDKNVMVAEVAKAYYVDRTMSEKDVQA